MVFKHFLHEQQILKLETLIQTHSQGLAELKLTDKFAHDIVLQKIKKIKEDIIKIKQQFPGNQDTGSADTISSTTPADSAPSGAVTESLDSI